MPRPLTIVALGGSALLVVLGVAVFWMAARSSTPQGGSDQIAFTVTDAACEPAALTVPAGRSSFRIQNASERTLEWEILDGVMVLAERENIAPGFNATTSVRLDPGTYAITCGLLSNPRGTLTVVATAESAAGAAAPETRAFIGPLSEYRVYVIRRSGQLIDALEALSDRIAAGDVAGAKTAWLEARRPWRQMAPVSSRIADLANSIDPVAAYLAEREADPAFTGFHRIEYGLWTEGSTEGLAPVATRLLADAETLKARLRELSLSPADLADNAADLASRAAVQAQGGQGYSQAELADFSAELEGIAKAVLLVDPLVAAANPQVSTALHQAIGGAQATLASFQTDGAFKPYDTVDDAGRQKIADAFTAVAAAASAVNPAIGLD